MKGDPSSSLWHALKGMVESARWTSLLAAIPIAGYRASQGGVPILLGLFIANRWGLEPLADYTVASALMAMAVIAADWGSSRLVPRELARGDASSLGVVQSVTGIRLILATIAVLACLAITSRGSVAPGVPFFMVLLVPAVFASVFTTNAVSSRVVQRDVLGLAIAAVAGVAPPLLAAALWHALDSGSWRVVAAYSVGKVIEAILLSGGRWHVQRFSLAHSRRIFLMMLPFGISGVIGVLYSRLPVFVLERYGTAEQLGTVAAATALQNVLLLVPAAIALLVYPRLTLAASAGDQPIINTMLRMYFTSSFIVFWAGWGMLVFWRLRVCEALGVPHTFAMFVILYVAVAGISIANLMTTTLLQARGAERVGARIAIVIVMLAIPLQVLMIKQNGAWGALTALVISEAIGGVLLAVGVRRTRHSATQLNGLAPDCVNVR